METRTKGLLKSKEFKMLLHYICKVDTKLDLYNIA